MCQIENYKCPVHRGVVEGDVTRCGAYKKTGSCESRNESIVLSKVGCCYNYENEPRPRVTSVASSITRSSGRSRRSSESSRPSHSSANTTVSTKRYNKIPKPYRTLSEFMGLVR